MCESFFVISKGPYLLGLSLAVGCVVFRWVASSQTFCPSSKGSYLVALIVICWACIIACCAACLMALVWVSLESIAGAKGWVFPMCAYGTCPMISSKGTCCFAAYQPSAPHLRDETRSARSPKSPNTFWTLVGLVLTYHTLICFPTSLLYHFPLFSCSPDRIDMPPDHSTPSPTIATPLYDLYARAIVIAPRA